MLTNMVQGIINGIGAMGRFIGYLPTSPFQNIGAIMGENPFIDAVLWLVPASQALSLLQAWVAAIALYYLVKVPLRWIKVIKG